MDLLVDSRQAKGVLRGALSSLYCALNSRIRWGQGSLESPRIPVPRSLVAIPERVHPESLLLAFVPGAFVAMAIGEAVDTEPVDLVPKVLTGVSIAISGRKFERQDRN
jgi:hypothetical protein